MNETTAKIILALIGAAVTVIVAVLPFVFSKIKQIHILVNSQSEWKSDMIAKQESANRVLAEANAALTKTNNDLQVIIAHSQPLQTTDKPKA